MLATQDYDNITVITGAPPEAEIVDERRVSIRITQAHELCRVVRLGHAWVSVHNGVSCEEHSGCTPLSGVELLIRY